MKPLPVAALVSLCLASSAGAQSLMGEVSLTGGVSSDRLSAGSSQGRLFGELPWFRYFAEGSWAGTTAGEHDPSEAFSSAYPYEGPPRVMDAYVERPFVRGRFVASVRGGRFRTPFGIFGASDHAYSGFLRAPLIRYEGYWALTNTLFEHGVNAMAGTPWVQAEVTVGRAADASDDFARRRGTDVVVRAQGYVGSIVLGMSHMRSQSYDLSYSAGPMVFTGIDGRWMRGGVQLRGEWLFGQPWDGVTTSGGYLDASLHRPFMGPVTVVGRVEMFDYDTPVPEFSSAGHGGALGARIMIVEGLHGLVNVTRRPSAPYGPNVTATDVALTYTVRYPK